MTEKIKTHKRKLKGVIVSDKMDKSVVVKVEKIKEHPKYKRRYKTHKKYIAHDETNEFSIGEKVVIEEHRPISKNKNWIVLPKNNSKKEEIKK